ncbi:hypothetical protein HDU98_009492 [Podochytrium sp. JEL0797]|nr:hypothetical protein HDU98_009489 [Podochytrium sp. JEL0797]KAJ3067330.1 hypothetical protein HDU98_009492 [Podochytrium sp. JEL0797]
MHVQEPPFPQEPCVFEHQFAGSTRGFGGKNKVAGMTPISSCEALAMVGEEIATEGAFILAVKGKANDILKGMHESIVVSRGRFYIKRIQ